MRLPWTAWEKTLRRLGLVRKMARRAPRSRHLRVESLESRDLLTTVWFALGSGSVMEGSSIQVTIQRDTPGSGLTVPFTPSGSASSADYSISPGSFTFVGTQTTASVTLTATADSVTPESESVSIALTPGGSYSLGSPSTIGISIQDVPPGGGGGGGGGQTVSVSAPDSSASESGPDPGNFRITRNGMGPLTVNFTLTGTAGSGDYSSSHTGHVDFGMSDTYVDVNITPQDDTLYEGTETVILTIAAGSGYTGSGSATVNIDDNDPQPSLSINDWTGPESSNASFFVVLSGPSPNPITVHYSTQNGTATGGNGSSGDYTSIGDSILTFNAGETSKQVTVTVRNDTDDEPDEDFFVNLWGESGASISDGQGKGIIQDNDAPNIWVDDAQVTEGGQLSFGVHLSYANSQTTKVSYSTAPWTANASDYSGVTGTLTFVGNSGVTLQTIVVTTIQDALDEDDEVFNLQLSSPINGQIIDGQADGTILDNDPLPAVSLTVLFPEKLAASIA